MGASNPARGPGVGIGLASAAAAVLAVLERALEHFDLRPIVFALLVFLAALAGWLLTRLRVHAARRERDRKLDEALACWFPPRVSQVSPFDVGAVPPARLSGNGKSAYVDRDADPLIEAALEQPSVVVVSGPILAGKSRSAFEAVKAKLGEAVALVPENAAGLAYLLAVDPPLDLRRTPAVVWLDGLDRYLDGLQLDALDSWCRRQGGQVWIVCTIRSETLEELLVGDDERSRVLRRLLARAHGIRLSDDLSARERRAIETVYGQAPATAAPGRFFLDAGPPPQPAYDSVEFECGIPRFPARQWADPVLLGLVAACVTVVLVLGAIARSPGWELPAPVADQLADLRDRLSACGRVDQWPRAASAVETARRVVFVSHETDRCGSSDAIRIYRLEHDSLVRRFAFQPAATSRSRYRFVCAGAGRSDPCTTEVSGQPVVLGGFVDDQHNDTLPIAVFPSRRDGFHVEGLFEKPARRSIDRLPVAARRAAEHQQEPVTLVNALRGDAITGHPVTAALVTAAPDNDKPLLVAGLIRRGSFDAPRQLALLAWRLDYAEDEPRLGPRCFPYKDTAPVRRVTVAVNGLTVDEPRDLRPLRKRWSDFSARYQTPCG